MSASEPGKPGATDARQFECPNCLSWGVHTPVEKRRRSLMNYCTFHYWLMKGREGFLLKAYAERSEHFGFVTSLPSPEEMARMDLAPELGMPELGSSLTLPEKLSAPVERLLFLPPRSATSGPGRTSGRPFVSSRVPRSEERPMFARETPQPICVPA